MHDAITVENKQIREAIWAVLESGGKMVRPAYLILFDVETKIEIRERSPCHPLAAARRTTSCRYDIT